MKVDIVIPTVTGNDTIPQVYLEGMKGYPNPKCRPSVTANLAQFELSLIDFYECGITLLHNQITVTKNFFFFFTLFIYMIFTYRGKKSIIIK